MTKTAGFFAALFALCLFVRVIPAFAAPFVYTASGETLPDFLCRYAASQDRACIVSPDISGEIAGNMNFRTPDAFFAFLERSHNLITYINDTGIYYYPRSAMQSVNLPLNRVTADSLRAALREMGVYDPRYPLRTINNGKMARLTAPPEYITLVTSLLADLEEGLVSAKGTRVFRLKHAWADDIEVTFLNRRTIIPGIASLLWRITAGGAHAPGGGGESPSTGEVERLKGAGLASRTGTQASSRLAREARQAEGSARQAQSGARILADPRLNAVIVWDDEELMPLYETLISELDRPVDLVEIRTAIVDVSIDRLLELGISWSANANPSGSGFGVAGGANTPEGTDFSGAVGSGLNLTTIFRSGMDVFMSRIHALEEDGDASVLSRPAVLTLDNTEASIEATNTYYIEVAGQEEVDLFDVSYGTILRVIPHVIADPVSGSNLIKLNVHVEDGGSRETSASSAVKYPIISKTMLNTQAVVGDNQALIIGGHYYERQIDGESGVPLLRHIPVLGGLFQHQSGQYQKQERLFILSPRLVSLEEVRRGSGQYAELFDRSMLMQAPVSGERSGGGCAPRRQARVIPPLMPAAPAAAARSAPAQGSP